MNLVKKKSTRRKPSRVKSTRSFSKNKNRKNKRIRNNQRSKNIRNMRGGKYDGLTPIERLQNSWWGRAAAAAAGAAAGAGAAAAGAGAGPLLNPGGVWRMPSGVSGEQLSTMQEEDWKDDIDYLRQYLIHGFSTRGKISDWPHISKSDNEMVEEIMDVANKLPIDELKPYIDETLDKLDMKIIL